MSVLKTPHKKVYLPKSNTCAKYIENPHEKTKIDDCHEIITSGSLVIIGANGTGKTRLGTWLDLKSPLWEKSLRISAQKSLTMPSSVQPKSIDEALNNLIYGYENGSAIYKINHRWQDERSATHFLNDFEKLMVYLFSEEMDANAKYTHQSRVSEEKLAPPLTKIAILKEVWESLLPHRELVIGGAKVETRVKGDEVNLYNSSQMSDGERVIFYLIGACLSAPENGVIIVDEPEIHIHKSLQEPLWRTLEAKRTDCLFVYITHDVDFASSQTDAIKLWLKNFDGKSWEWEEISKEESFSEDLLLEIMGSRRKVIFVEGESGSHDLSLYRILFPNHLIIPRGSCTKVINDIRTLRKLPHFHHLDIIGIIDRDRRVDEEIISLQQDGIYVLPVAEVENLFCTKEIISYCCELLSRDFNDDITLIQKEIFKSFNHEKENQLSLRVISEVKFRLNALDEKGKGSEQIKSKIKELIDNIDVDELYFSFECIFDKILQDKNYNDLLKYYNRKSLKDKVGKILGVSDLPALVTRSAHVNNNNIKIKEMLRKYFRVIPGY
ncbi:TPA: AAA family ATPase [Enterobacter cancerogenus]|nr:AAA family ATPase [Enterobacter cancerogenus]HDR2164629.1 AAA family ATPase [Enterobacter cancerogenus]HDR2267403.1 AAA family ATPase [Enterobacter cancerogenus]